MFSIVRVALFASLFITTTATAVDINRNSLIRKDIQTVVAGDYNTMIITNDGRLYITNNHMESSDTNSNLELITTGVDHASLGKFSAIIRQNGNLFYIGENYRGSLGFPGVDKLESWSKHPVKRLNTGKTRTIDNTTVVVNDDNELFVFGGNSNNVISSRDGDVLSPIKVSDHVVDAIASQIYISYINKKGELFVKGLYDYGFGGTGGFTKIDSNVEAIDGGIHHLLYTKINNDGVKELYAIGGAMQGQLGVLLDKIAVTFLDNYTEKPILIASNVKDFAAGGYHSLYVDNKGDLYVSGNNGNGQLGLGDTTPRILWTKAKSNIQKVFAGWFQSFLIADDGALWISGNNSQGQLTFKSDNINSYFYGKDIKTNIEKWSFKPIYLEKIRLAEDGLKALSRVKYENN